MNAPRPNGARRVRRHLALAAGLAAIGLTVVVVMRATRTPPAPVEAAHVHGAPAAREGVPVMLGAGEAARIGVTFATAEFGPLVREIRSVAQVTYDETRLVTVALRLDGWVERLFVNIEGQPVTAGQPLFDLYAPMAVSAEEELLAALRLAQAVDSGTSAARSGALAVVEAARQRLRNWGVPAATVEEVERSGTVRNTIRFPSPVGGVVVERRVLEGERIQAGEPLYRIADLSRVWLEGEVFEPDLPAARPGLVVTAEFAALPGVTRTGRITYVYPTLDPDTRTGRIRVELANPDLMLKPGMYATIRFSAPERSVLSVPRSAVLATGERNFVFVADQDGMFTPRAVALGTATDDRIEILRGLAAGERVVASGTFLLDAESNLGAAMGGMGDMPGMDMKAPSAPGGADAHANH